MTITENLDNILNKDGTVLLDGASGKEGDASFLFRDPVRTLSASSLEDVESVLLELDQAIQRGFYVAGYLSYEAGYAFLPEKLAELHGADWGARIGYPLVWFGVYEKRESLRPSELGSLKQSEQSFPTWSETQPQSSFESSVETIRDLIHEGDLYQINHTTRFVADCVEDPVALYQLLRTKQPVRYGSFLRTGDVTVLSLSPELFFEHVGHAITARPMKGTAARGDTPEEDESLREWLQNDEKNRAENLMIVDLLRNDLSRVCEPGSVEVEHLFAVERLPSVHQMTSTVHGKLKEGTGLAALMQALFPCGSITGAPKIRAMRRIAELEAEPRGVYCGAIGYAGPGEGCFSVAIRTAVLSDGQMTFGAGGGIVWDSEPEDEYAEALLKKQFVSSESRAELELIESMRWDGGLSLLAFHMDRLQASSDEMGFGFERAEAESLIEKYCAALPGDEPRKLRLLLNRHGEMTIADSQIPEIRDDVMLVGLSSVRIASGHPRYHHKTTDRDAFDRARAEARAHGWFDALLTNERGEITEGAITNVFLRLGGQWVTPPLDSGLLAGVGRRVFMLQNSVREQLCLPEDLQKADQIVLTNAVIGARTARFSS